MDTNERLKALANMYINDTCCDGQLFCACRKEDCDSYKTDECINCLMQHIEGTFEIGTIKGIEWHDMSTQPCLNGETDCISKVVLISMTGGIIDGLAHYDYDVDAWYTDGVNVEHKLVEPKYWAYR